MSEETPVLYREDNGDIFIVTNSSLNPAEGVVITMLEDELTPIATSRDLTDRTPITFDSIESEQVREVVNKLIQIINEMKEANRDPALCPINQDAMYAYAALIHDFNPQSSEASMKQYVRK